MTNRKYQLHTLILGFLLICILGCERYDRSSSSTPQGSSSTPQRSSTFAMNVLVSGVPFFNDTKATWKAMGDGLNVKTVYGGPLDTDAQKQSDQIDILISQRVNGIVVAPTDSAALAPAINRAVDQGIPVVTYLNDVPTSKRIAYVTSERETASLKIGHLVADATARPTKAFIMYSQAGNEEQEGRRHGFELLAKEIPSLHIVAVVTDKFDEAQGAAQLRPLLARYPDVNYVFGCNSRSAVGAVSALKELHYSPGKVIVTGWDYDEDVLDLIQQGWVKVTDAQNTPFMTQIAFNLLKAQTGGWLYPLNRQFQQYGVRPVPNQLIIPSDLVTDANVKGYYPRSTTTSH